MTAFDLLNEIFPVVLSSVGLTGSVFAVIIGTAIRKAKTDADRKRNERLRIEILRLEGEEKMSALIFAMLRHERGTGSEKELTDAEEAYLDYLESSHRLKNEIIGMHTSN